MHQLFLYTVGNYGNMTCPSPIPHPPHTHEIVFRQAYSFLTILLTNITILIGIWLPTIALYWARGSPQSKATVILSKPWATLADGTSILPLDDTELTERLDLIRKIEDRVEYAMEVSAESFALLLFEPIEYLRILAEDAGLAEMGLLQQVPDIMRLLKIWTPER